MKMKIKKTLSILAAAVMVLGLVGCGNTNKNNAASGNSKRTDSNKVVKVGVVGMDDNPLLENGCLALKKKYFEEELKAAGYKLELVTFPNGGPGINESYATGEIDLAVYGDLPASVCYSGGVDIKVIGSANGQVNTGVIVNKASGIKSVKDLEGKKVIVGKGTIYHEYWQRLVDEYDIDESKVQIINVVSDAETVFTSGEADAWITFYYNTLYYEKQGLGTTIENTVDHPEMASQCVVTGRSEYLKENPKAATAFLKALKRAQEYAVKHPDELYEAVASSTIGVDVYKKSYGFDKNFAYLSPEISDATRDKFEYLNKFLVGQGLIQKEVNLDEFIDKSYQ